MKVSRWKTCGNNNDEDEEDDLVLHQQVKLSRIFINLLPSSAGRGRDMITPWLHKGLAIPAPKGPLTLSP